MKPQKRQEIYYCPIAAGGTGMRAEARWRSHAGGSAHLCIALAIFNLSEKDSRVASGFRNQAKLSRDKCLYLLLSQRTDGYQ